MEKMAREVFEELQPAVDSSKLQMEIEHLPHSSGDRAMMHQVFVNLLSNAIKFSRNKEPAKIKVGCSIEGDEAVYYVKDNGAGFDMQYAGKLFGVFQRLHGVTSSKAPASGLPSSNASSPATAGGCGRKASQRGRNDLFALRAR